MDSPNNDFPCYGHYKEQSYTGSEGMPASTGDCGRCRIAKWCSSAADPIVTRRSSLEKVSYSAQYATSAAFSVPESECDRCSRAMARCVRDLVELKSKNSLRFAILMEKLASPKSTYSEIAAKFKKNKQLVQYHLTVAIGQFPELVNAVVINRNYNPGKKGILKMLAKKSPDADAAPREQRGDFTEGF